MSKTMSVDNKSTVFLPKTDFPMKGGLPDLEPRLLARWAEMGLYTRLRAEAKGQLPLQRAAGAYVVLVDGEAALYLERGGHSLQTLPAADVPAVAAPAAQSLHFLVESGHFRELVITRVDGEPVAASPWRSLLDGAGFVAGYRGHVLRPGSRRVVAAGRGLAPETAATDEYWRRSGSGRSEGHSRRR